MSAPERSSLAIYSSKSKSSANVIRLVCILNIRHFVFWSGKGNSIFLSIRPVIEYMKVTDWKGKASDAYLESNRTSTIDTKIVHG